MKADRAVPGVLGFVASETADLLVVGTHRPGRLERASYGSGGPHGPRGVTVHAHRVNGDGQLDAEDVCAERADG